VSSINSRNRRVRFSIDELHGDSGFSSDGDGRRTIELLGELPDLWDIALGGSLGNDSCSSRFSAEGYQEKYVAIVKSHTSKPVVNVGRFTSPDTMVGQIKRGVQDFIGAARPSIADPFLPSKIERGLEDQIRECIGCNICRSANNEGAPLRCTQNPTMGEEWRRNWHPEIIPPAASKDNILVVGAGPAGLEAALALGRRGHRVTLAEAGAVLGGRVVAEAGLPGLQNWIRVRDYRSYMLSQMDNVEIFLESELDAAGVAEFGADQTVIATGSRWRRDGLGHSKRLPVEIDSDAIILTPDDVFSGAEIPAEILIYDDDHYFMAGALAERLLLAGHRVIYVTPAESISSWSAMTNEHEFIQQRLLSLGIETRLAQNLLRIGKDSLTTGSIYNADETEHNFSCLLLVTSREPNDNLFQQLPAGSAKRIGDCLVPSSIADAVYRGHKFAREYGEDPAQLVPRRERTVLQPILAQQSEG
jgi:dimethylamine/trimethylamine dehydrogenase